MKEHIPILQDNEPIGLGDLLGDARFLIFTIMKNIRNISLEC